MEHKAKALIPLVIGLLLAACQGNHTAEKGEAGDTLCLRHARLLTLVQHPHHMEAIVRNPWDTTHILRRYILCTEATAQTTAEAIAVRVPLRRAAVFGSVHCGVMHELDCLDALAGVCEAKYIHNSAVRERVRQGQVANLGSAMAPNVEQIIAMDTDAALLSASQATDTQHRLHTLGIPVVECAEYMEVSPLAQAEWIRFYGRLFGRGREADSLFEAVEKEYLRLRRLASQAQHQPTVICEVPYEGVWHVAAGHSTTGQLVADAGARYAFAHLRGTGTAPLSIEQALAHALRAHIWLVKRFGPATRQQLTATAPGLDQIGAQMWLCDTEASPYYEETPFHPEWILAHFIQICHPEMGVNSVKTYFQPLP